MTLRPAPNHDLISRGWIDTTTPPSLCAEYRLGIVRLEYHAPCETWRARVGGNDWGYDGATPNEALQRCSVPAPAADDMRIARQSLTRDAVRQVALL
jgi:hypothetical protein